MTKHNFPPRCVLFNFASLSILTGSSFVVSKSEIDFDVIDAVRRHQCHHTR